MTKTALSLIAILLAIVLACLPLMIHGPQTGHSLYVNLPWSHHFAQAVLEGVYYPRWLMEMNQGAGSPAFFYYAPVPFYFSTLPAALLPQLSEAVHLGIGQFLIVLASACSFFLFSRRYAAQGIACFAGIAYALAPYHFGMDLLTRQSYGEAAAFTWVPLVFLAVEKLADEGRGLVLLAVSYALLVMTHLPAALLCSPFFLLHCILRCSFERDWILALRFGAGIGTGLLLACCYLVPALATQGYTYTEHLWINYFDIDRWFFFDDVVAPEPEVEDRVFELALASAIVFAISWPVAWFCAPRRHRPLILGLLILYLGAWFMMTPLSLWLWQLIPVLQKAQFPWRIMVVLEFALVTTLALALAFTWRPMRPRWLAVAGAAAVAFSGWSAYVSYEDYQQHLELIGDEANVRSLQGQARGGNDAREYLPLTVKSSRRRFLDHMSTLDRLVYDRGQGHIEIVKWENRSIVLDMRMRSATPVAVKQLVYPGWEVTINNAPVQFEPTRRYGLIRFDAPPGVYQVEMTLHTLPEERLGWVLSGVGVLTLLLVAVINGYLPRRFNDSRPTHD